MCTGNDVETVVAARRLDWPLERRGRRGCCRGVTV